MGVGERDKTVSGCRCRRRFKFSSGLGWWDGCIEGGAWEQEKKDPCNLSNLSFGCFVLSYSRKGLSRAGVVENKKKMGKSKKEGRGFMG